MNSEGMKPNLEVESEKPQIILLLASGIVWHVLHHHLHCVDIGVHLHKMIATFSIATVFSYFPSINNGQVRDNNSHCDRC